LLKNFRNNFLEKIYIFHKRKQRKKTKRKKLRVQSQKKEAPPTKNHRKIYKVSL
jgi:hypothetical protein